MKINEDKNIGRVLFIVEGGKTEFNILKRIFVNLFKYNYIEKKRHKVDYFRKDNNSHSEVAIINTVESNITSISNDEHLDDIFEELINQYSFKVDSCAIFYIFDRDPKSNTDTDAITKYLLELKNPYENENYKAGQLILSYPCFEAFKISNFKDTSNLEFSLGHDCKTYIAQNTDIQDNKLSIETLNHATNEFLEFLKRENIDLDIDEFESYKIFELEETHFQSTKTYKLFSSLILVFLQLGIIELE